MVRLLRFYLLACIAFAFAYLLLHVWEPLRLNVGDPWSDADLASSVDRIRQHGFTTDTIDVDPMISPAYRPTHAPPAAELTYGVMGKLGVTDVGVFRLFALALSGLAMWLLFGYARRMWNDTVALIATALFSTSVLWMMYADSIHRPPGAYAFCFLALWGLVQAIQTGRPRHQAALVAGSFACWFAAPDHRVLLVVGALFTIYIKLGNPFGRDHRRFVLLCAAGCLAAIAVSSILEIGPVEWQPGVIEWREDISDKLAASTATLVRRYSLVFTPMFWITLGYTALRVLRAPSLTSVLRDGMTWLAVAAAVFLYVSPHHTVSPMLRAEPLLPFYAIGSALLIARLLESGRIRRAVAIMWVAVAPVWGFAIMLSHPRAVLDRGDVAKVRSYLAAHDRNDFVMSNLLADGPIQAAFDRRSWPALEADDPKNLPPLLVQMLDVFENTGTDQIHAVIFTTPESRFIDRSLGQLLKQRRLASVTGWPYMVRSKANAIIRDYDRRVVRYLEAVGAERVLRLTNFDVYRVDRRSVLEAAGRSVPVVRKIDFSSLTSSKHKLLGWGHPRVTDDDLGASSIDGYLTCANPVDRLACSTALTPYGLYVLDRGFVYRGQLMIRVERACDLRLTFELASSLRLWRLPQKVASRSLLAVSLNDFTGEQCEPSDRVAFVIPQRSVRAGVNIITVEKKRFGPMDPRADLMSLAIEPLCASAP